MMTVFCGRVGVHGKYCMAMVVLVRSMFFLHHSHVDRICKLAGDVRIQIMDWLHL